MCVSWQERIHEKSNAASFNTIIISIPVVHLGMPAKLLIFNKWEFLKYLL
jgi:hypothetical protein